MSDTEELVAQLEALEAQVKAMHRAFVTVAWELVEARSPEEEAVCVQRLREVGQQKRAHEEQLRALHATRHVQKKQAKQDYHRNELALVAEAKQQKHALQRERTRAWEESRRAAVAEADARRAKAELAEMERLAAEEKRDKIIAAAISNGRLKPVVETRQQRLVNDQRRSNGGVIRLESGDGR